MSLLSFYLAWRNIIRSFEGYMCFKVSPTVIDVILYYIYTHTVVKQCYINETTGPTAQSDNSMCSFLASISFIPDRHN